jgi:hypothetical protein
VEKDSKERKACGMLMVDLHSQKRRIYDEDNQTFGLVAHVDGMYYGWTLGCR